ncbi:TylF/MycF/NovP-related O-methyltransferase [Thermodesulfobacteriota bacterium]
MIELPDFSRAYDYENSFYLSCATDRMSKVIAHYELYKMVQDIPGAIVECGVFKGASFVRFAMLRDILGSNFSKQMIGFDCFGEFPESSLPSDQIHRQQLIDNAGDQSISTEQLRSVLKHKGIDSFYDLIEGDIVKTIPEYVEKHPELRISLLNMDADLYDPSVTILEYLYPKIVKGGILLIDDYGFFPGETKAVDEFFADKDITINKFPFCMTPCYIVKR